MRYLVALAGGDAQQVLLPRLKRPVDMAIRRSGGSVVVLVAPQHADPHLNLNVVYLEGTVVEHSPAGFGVANGNGRAIAVQGLAGRPLPPLGARVAVHGRLEAATVIAEEVTALSPRPGD